MESLHIKLTGRYIPGTGPPVTTPASLPQQPNMRRRHHPRQPHIAVLRKPVPRQPQARPRKVEVARMRPTPVVTAPPPPPTPVVTAPPPPVTENTVPEVVFEDETM